MEKIRTDFDATINSYIVIFPDFVTLEALRLWGSCFLVELGRRSGRANLLLDTNSHDFESIACLKWLRDFFYKEPKIMCTIRRVALVQPIEYRSPEVINESEAYFSSTKDARNWLKQVN